MRILRFIGMALFAVLMCVNFASCSSDDIEPNESQKGKEVVVSLGFSGDFEISESPLSRATSNDLYIVDVRQYPTATSVNVDGYYAYGLFDDLEAVKINLIEGETYCFFAKIIKDGKLKLKHDGNTYSNYPFITSLTLNNSFTYSKTSLDLDRDQWVLADGKTYYLPNITYYENEFYNSRYTAVEGGSVTLDMKRWAFGAKFEAINLPEGTLDISIVDENSGVSPTITLDKTTLSKEDIFYFPSQYSNESLDFNLSVIWTKNGVTKDLGSPKISFKKNMVTTVKITVTKNTENGISFVVDDSTMGNGDIYNVDGDKVTKQ